MRSPRRPAMPVLDLLVVRIVLVVVEESLDRLANSNQVSLALLLKLRQAIKLRGEKGCKVAI